MLLLAGVFTVLLCVSALAAGEGMYAVSAGLTPDVATTETVTINDKEEILYVGAEKVTLTYESAMAGKYYLVLALNDGSTTPTVSNIAYIDQDTATGETVSFTVYPNKLENGKTYTVYLSSNDGTLTTLTEQGSFSYYVPYKLGDADLSGEVDAYDATVVLRHVAKIQYITTPNALLAADANRSGDVDADDATRILRYVAKIDSILG